MVKVLFWLGILQVTKMTHQCAIPRQGSLPTAEVTYKSCAMEADKRIWRHVALVDYQNILVYSPDTDVYDIGMTILTS